MLLVIKMHYCVATIFGVRTAVIIVSQDNGRNIIPVRISDWKVNEHIYVCTSE